jgi:hypothetical protein
MRAAPSFAVGILRHINDAILHCAAERHRQIRQAVLAFASLAAEIADVLHEVGQAGVVLGVVGERSHGLVTS